jgi:hypothetical protein
MSGDDAEASVAIAAELGDERGVATLLQDDHLEPRVTLAAQALHQLLQRFGTTEGANDH